MVLSPLPASLPKDDSWVSSALSLPSESPDTSPLPQWRKLELCVLKPDPEREPQVSSDRGGGGHP